MSANTSGMKKVRRKKGTSYYIKKVLFYGILLLLSLICVIPLYWMFRSSFMKNTDIYSMRPFIFWPREMLWSNYTDALKAADFGRYAANTMIIVIGCLVGTLLTSSMAAYAFSRVKWKGRGVCFAMILTTMMLPSSVTLIPQFMIWRNLNLIDTYWPLILPAFFGGGAFNIFLLRQFFLGIPRDLDDAARITGGFWKEYQELFRRVTVDAVYDRFEETGRFEALKFNWKEGMPGKPHIFWESDVTKWIEGAAYFLQEQRDPKLEDRIDELVARMERTQGEDGYLNAYFTVVEPKARFTRRTDHELYCAGHLIEGAIAYAKATGKENMLRVAIRYADLIDRVFRIGHSASFDTPGHEEIELALVKLYHYTGEERYLKLAQYFVDTRGKSSRDETYDFADQEHMQSHLPVREQRTAEGHSVRALYLYSGMADLAMETGEEELLLSCKRLFDNIVQKRMYLTGGVGSTCRGESFTFDYDLPEYTAYNETCASIALALFCRRMWLMDADGRYGDVAEQAIYNTVLSGVSLSGNEFYYENPMSADPRRNAFNDLRPAGLREHLPILKRVRVFDCSCCPPNLLRIVGSIGDFLYSVSDRTIYAHCYMESESEVSLGEKKVSLSQQSAYPLEGKILITVKGEGDFTLALRIPGWCRGAKISVNGQEYAFEKVKGFAFLQRNWKNGDQVLLDLPMEVKWIRANPQVIEACGRVAVMRGPFVYCAEGVDNDNRPLKAVRIAAGSAVAVSMQRIGGFSLPVLSMEAFCRKPMEALYTWEPGQEEEFRLKLIPYFAWANRGVTEMTTWFLEKQ